MDLRGHAVLVAGAGVTGRSVVTTLCDAGARVTVTDANAERLAALADTPARTELGLTRPPDGTDLVVTSPGWRPDSPLLAAAAAEGIDVIGDVELAWRIGSERKPPPVWLAVTGTNGKTTTVGMLAAMLRASGTNAVACGNVGFAVLDAVLAGYEVLAVELSSFQLHWSRSLAPRASVVLNVAEDHLDWHGDLDAYAAAKGTLHAATQVAVANADDAISTRLVADHADPDARWVGFTLGKPKPGQLGIVDGSLVDAAYSDEPVVLADVADVRPEGDHNVANALAAAALARAYGIAPDAIRDGLRAFTPGEHRAAEVATVAGVRYINDSKATNPHAASGSLLSYEHVVWIAGGQLKGAEVDSLVAAAAERLRGVVLLGADADVIADAVSRHAPDVPMTALDSGDDDPMVAAVSAASAWARPGDVVLLAPAAASLDMFRDYAHRGEAFAAAVRALAGESADGSG
ncbi:UDP-N-acetylmuramoyl-L-alanine--D-glutamate ligase [Haloechinothrix salitolerans]|uniref:UDP-N-acetylmuramoylalanine--D-glutamate ligase n=1 Tax=Haloechinothrix salitolerans TaxID=926830 RepID=A0ABW2C4E1_9PSEU